MKYYLIAGEASGDLHGSNLIKALKNKDPEADIRCWGGDLMQAAGGTLVTHYKERAFMGFLEILGNLRKILGFIKACKADVAEFAPDALILIDNSGFNLRIAAWAKAAGFTTHYYISPQIWASREGRIEKIKRDVDFMYVILPFEKDFYENKHRYPVQFVGHPLIDAIGQAQAVDAATFRKENGLHPEKPIIALLPGSRKQEVRKMLDRMLSIVPRFNDYQFVIAGAPSLDTEFYNSFTTEGVHFVKNQTYPLLSLSYAALVTSGTATLETALFKVPQVVCYRAHWLSYEIAKRIITLRFISLVNLIMDREVVTELIQKDLNTARLHSELEAILNGPKREAIFEAYYELEQKLGGAGASEQAAEGIIRNHSQPKN